MKYEEVLFSLHINKKLNEKGYSDYVGILRREVIDLKQKIIDLENELQYKKGEKQ